MTRMCQVEIRRIKVQTRPCRIDVAKLHHSVMNSVDLGKFQKCLLDIFQCRVMLRKMKIQMTPCRVILPRLTQRHTMLTGLMQLQTYTPEMLQFNPQPRTVKQRMKNCQVLAKYNFSYQDDIFDKLALTGSKVRLLTTTDPLIQRTPCP